MRMGRAPWIPLRLRATALRRELFFMIECIFTIDYEIYGSGRGSLRDLVCDPAERLMALFRECGKRFVAFVEVAELEMIEAEGADPTIDLVKRQIRDLHSDGFELGLHLHPWWYSGRYEGGQWVHDHREYNLCTLCRERIDEIIGRAFSFLRATLGDPDFTPLSYRGGHLLFQPTQPLAGILAGHGVRVDSSVYKGGLWRRHGLDYCQAIRNGPYWRFGDEVNVPDPQGRLLELPVYTQMVPTWEMFTSKRVEQQRGGTSAAGIGRKAFSRLWDFLRLRYPLKFDICSLTFKELTRMVDAAIREDQESPSQLWPLVAIGHTKDLVDFETVEALLAYLARKGIPVSTFSDVYPRCIG